jgi:hypothetical protein
MTDAAIAAEIHQPLDVHRNLPPQIAFDREPGDHVAKPRDLRLVQILDRRRGIDLRGFTGVQRARLRPMPWICVSAIEMCLLTGMLIPAIRAMK